MNFLRIKCTKSTIFVFAMLLTGISCSVSREDLLQRRADRGDIQAMMELAAANESLTGGGFIRKPNTGKSKELYRKAAALGHTPAMYVLSQFLSDSITNEERVMWLKKGAELGNGACVTELINAYSQGLYGLKPDPVQSFQWVKIGWQMDFKERKYDSVIARKEYDRLINNYRSHLKVGLRQKGYKNEDIDAILSQIK